MSKIGYGGVGSNEAVFLQVVHEVGYGFGVLPLLGVDERQYRIAVFNGFVSLSIFFRCHFQYGNTCDSYMVAFSQLEYLNKEVVDGELLVGFDMLDEVLLKLHVISYKSQDEVMKDVCVFVEMH